MNTTNLLHRLARLAPLAVALGLLSQSGVAAEIDLLSAPTTVSAGQQFTVSVYVSGITDLYGYGFDLGFNQGLVQELSASEGAFLGLGGPTFHIDGVVDNTGGVVSGVGNTLLGDVLGVDGSGTLESFVFRATAAGTSVTQGLVHFGEVWPGAPVPSADTITVVTGATFSPAALQLTAVAEGALASTLPIADAGPAQSVFAGQEVVLDGSHSTDPAGNALSYAWTVTSLPVGSKATLANAAPVRPVFVTDVSGTYTFSLVVKDANGSSAPSTVTVSTTPINVAPVAKAGPDQLVAPGRCRWRASGCRCTALRSRTATS